MPKITCVVCNKEKMMPKVGRGSERCCSPACHYKAYKKRKDKKRRKVV